MLIPFDLRGPEGRLFHGCADAYDSSAGCEGAFFPRLPKPWTGAPGI